MTPYERGYAAGLKAAAEYAATHTGSDSPVFRDTVTATETIRFAYQWQRAVYAGILSLPIHGEATNPGEQVPDSARIGSEPHVTTPARPGPSQECVMVPRGLLVALLNDMYSNIRHELAAEIRAMLAATRKEEGNG